jgi:hypothetical protein
MVKSQYKGIVKFSLLSLFGWWAISSFEVSSLIAIPLSILMSLLCLYLINSKRSRQRRLLINKLREQCVHGGNTSLDGQQDWNKGIGFIGQVSDPMAWRRCDDGLELMFYSQARKRSMILSWDKIMQLKWSESKMDYIKLRLYQFDYDVVIPYDSVLVDDIPDSVGVVIL